MQSMFRKNVPRMILVFCMMLCLVASLTGCGGDQKTKSVSLTCDNGAEVVLYVNTAGGFDVGVNDNKVMIEAEGAVVGYLITKEESNQILSGHFGDGTYSEMTINGGTAFGYESTDDGVVHIIPVDDYTYLRLTSSRNESLYTAETIMTIESVKKGSESMNDFARSVSQYGVSEDELDFSGSDVSDISEETTEADDSLNNVSSNEVDAPNNVSTDVIEENVVDNVDESGASAVPVSP